jgi:hypothetical protein
VVINNKDNKDKDNDDIVNFIVKDDKSKDKVNK